MGTGDLAELVRRGVAVVLATSDELLRPEIGRAWGPLLSNDGAELTVCVEAPPGSTMATNLRPGAPVAIHVAAMITRGAVALQGRVVSVAATGSVDRTRVATHLDAFTAEVARLGVPETVAHGLLGPELLRVTVQVLDIRDDSIGPPRRRSA